MKISRRNFLTASGLAIAATTLETTCIVAEEKAAENTSIDLQDWSVVRDQFDLTREYIHMSSFYIVSHPRPVREAIEKYRKEIDSNPFLTVEHGLFNSQGKSKNEKVKVAAAKYLNATPAEIALTSNTTNGLALIYNGLQLKSGQEIVTTIHDHYSHHESIRWAAEKAGATVKKIALFDSYDSITEAGIVSRILGAVSSNTRAVGVTWVHSSSGLKLPIRKIADGLRDINLNRNEADRVLLIVDGVHGFGIENETADSLGMDLFAAGTHKWILGPRGTGIIWGSKDSWKQLRPTIPTFDSDELFSAWLENRPPSPPTRAAWVDPGGFHAYEHRWALAEAFHFHLQIGKDRVEKRIHSLNSQCKEALASIRGVRVITPGDPRLSAGIICFEVDGRTADQTVEYLLTKKIIASSSPYPVSFARIAPSLVNTPEEVETTVREIRSLARS